MAYPLFDASEEPKYVFAHNLGEKEKEEEDVRRMFEKCKRAGTAGA